MFKGLGFRVVGLFCPGATDGLGNLLEADLESVGIGLY